MAYIIDGHNLIGILPDISLTQPDDEARLIDQLLSFRAQGAREMIVFFDGDPLSTSPYPRAHPGAISSRPGLDIHYSLEGKTADDAIVEFLRASRQPGQYAVVTNDTGLIGRVRNLGASVLRASEFSIQMARQKPKKRTPASVAESTAPDPRAPAFADLYDQFLAAEKVRKHSASRPRVDTSVLVERLYTGDPQLQVQAARALGLSHDPAAVTPLTDALTSKDAPLRAEACLALGVLRSAAAVAGLADVLATDGNSMVREAAAQALGSIGSGKAIPALEAAEKADTKSKVRKAARAALETIRARRPAL